MKLSRDDLKSIVKEVLVEILAEGLNESSRSINESRKSQPAQQPRQHQEVSARSMVADKISFLPRQAQQQQPQPRGIDRRALNVMTSDPILQEMLADTAVRGTPIIEESKGGNMAQEVAIAAQGDAAAKAMMRSDPNDLFGDASSKWATLAFSEKKFGT